MPTGRGKKKRLTTKESAWLKAFFENNGNKTQAAKDAGYKAKDDASFSSIGHENFIKLQPYILKWLDSSALSETALKNKLNQLLHAKEIKLTSFEGRFTDERVLEALETQRKTLDMALKVRGMYAPEVVKHIENTETIEDIEKDIARLEKILNISNTKKMDKKDKKKINRKNKNP